MGKSAHVLRLEAVGVVTTLGRAFVRPRATGRGLYLELGLLRPRRAMEFPEHRERPGEVGNSSGATTTQACPIE